MTNVSPEHAELVDDIEDTSPIRPRRRPEPDSEMDITPMIDIVFLLLIFFIVTSKLSDSAEVQLPEARYGDVVAANDSVVLTLSDEGEAGVQIFLGDGIGPSTLVNVADEADQDTQIISYIEGALLGPPRKQHVIVKAAKKLKHGQVARIQRIIGKVPDVNQIYFAVLEGQ